jgi:hypothetical protein
MRKMMPFNKRLMKCYPEIVSNIRKNIPNSGQITITFCDRKKVLDGKKFLGLCDIFSDGSIEEDIMTYFYRIVGKFQRELYMFYPNGFCEMREIDFIGT